MWLQISTYSAIIFIFLLVLIIIIFCSVSSLFATMMTVSFIVNEKE